LATCFCALQKHELALRTVDRALQLHSSFATALGLKGHIQVFSSDTKNGRTNLLRSIELNSVDPHFGIWLNSLAVADFLDGDYESALKWIEKATSTNSYWLQNYVLLSCLFSATGELEKARKNFEKLKKVAPRFSRDNWLYSHPFAHLEVENKFLGHLRQFGF
jgi:tetratricopeptide (TPR) repeat protein